MYDIGVLLEFVPEKIGFLSYCESIGPCWTVQDNITRLLVASLSSTRRNKLVCPNNHAMFCLCFGLWCRNLYKRKKKGL